MRLRPPTRELTVRAQILPGRSDRHLASGGGGERGDLPSYVVRIDDVLFCRAMVKDLVGLERVVQRNSLGVHYIDQVVEASPENGLHQVTAVFEYRALYGGDVRRLDPRLAEVERVSSLFLHFVPGL